MASCFAPPSLRVLPREADLVFLSRGEHSPRRPFLYFADLKKGDEFVRLPVNNRSETAALIREAKRALAD